MDSPITNPLVAIKCRAKKYELQEKAILSRFVKGVVKGLSESLKTRAAGGYYNSWSEPVEVTIEDLTDFERVNQWNSRSRLSSSSEMVDTPDFKKFIKFQRLRKRASHLNPDLPWWMNQFDEEVRPTRIVIEFVERIKAGSILSMTIVLQEVIDECSAFERLDGYRTTNKPSSRIITNHHSTQSLTTKLTDKESHVEALS
ncbi:hypothetical protein GEMRC1_009552 [Eukaryota sp. GEM-RC1]